ncbi:MAG: hypothetical protein ACO4BJ_00970 [Planctomycetota bacterium]|jgi:hypothetical protein
MPRHRGRYDASNPRPYELSRSRVESFIRCPACFWLDRAAGVKFPGLPGFNLNTNTDTLLKRDFDACRGRGPHPLMERHGLGHLRPFEHEDVGKWADSLHFGRTPEHFNTVHAPTNILFGGGLDDVWENPATGELHIVDYKSTAQLGRNPWRLDERFIAPPKDPDKPDWKAGYRRQMDMYQWVMRRKGFAVSDTGYFVYVDGQHIGIDGMIDPADPSRAVMEFQAAILPYHGDDGWVESALFEVKRCLEEERCPEHGEGCEYGEFLEGVRGVE